MAAMGTPDRLAVSVQFQTILSHRLDVLGAVLRADILAAVNAVDDWVVANSASFNTAIPTAARTGLTTSQKAELLSYVIARRFLVGA